MWAVELFSRCRNAESSADRRSGLAMPSIVPAREPPVNDWPRTRVEACASARAVGVDLLLGDLAVVGNVGVVEVTEFVVAVQEAPEPVAAGLVAFEVPVNADHERDQRDRRGEFDPAVGEDLRLAPERQGEDHVSSKTPLCRPQGVRHRGGRACSVSYARQCRRTRPRLGSGSMPQHDKRIPENARCSTCAGSGWTSWSAPETQEGGSEPPKWIICRECLGTGR